MLNEMAIIRDQIKPAKTCIYTYNMNYRQNIENSRITFTSFILT